MTENIELFVEFQKWIQGEISREFPDIEFGVADQSVENVAWLNLNTKETISGIKIWSTGDYYCEILTLDKKEPEMAVFEKLEKDQDFSAAFSAFLNRIRIIDDRIS